MEEKRSTKISISEWIRDVEMLHDEFTDCGSGFQNLNKEIETLKDEVIHISNMLEEEKKDRSDEELVEQELRRAKHDYEEQIAKEEKQHQDRQLLANSDNKDRKLKEIAQYQFQKREEIKQQQTSLAEVNREKSENQSAVCMTQDKIKKGEAELSGLQSDEVQIAMIKNLIATDYNKVTANTGFISDYKDPRGATPQDAEQMYLSMSTERLCAVADSMQRGEYASSPEEVKGIPIGEIFKTTFSTILCILAMVFMFIPKLYKPVRGIRKFSNKILYCLGVTLGLILVFSLLLEKAGVAIGLILIGILLILLLIAIISFIVNFVKFSNVEKRRLLNLEYYTAGYYFLTNPDMILERFATTRFHWLRQNKPENLVKMMEGEVQRLNTQINQLKMDLSHLQKAYDNNCIRVESIQKKIDELTKDHGEMTIQKKYEEELYEELKCIEESHKTNMVEFEEGYKARVENAEQNAKLAKSNREEHIKELKEQLTNQENVLSEKKKELEEFRVQLSDLVKKGENCENQFRSDVETEGNSERDDDKNMQLPETMFVGTGFEEIGDKYACYRLLTVRKIDMNHNPVLICLAGDRGLAESDLTTGQFYRMLDLMLYQLFDQMYYNAFSLQIFDEKEKNLKKWFFWMAEHLNIWDNLIDAKCIIPSDDKNVDQFFDKLIHMREKELDGKTVEQINNRNKTTDNPVRRILMVVRLYDEKSSFLKELKANLKRCKDNEIIPIIFITHDCFELIKKNDSFRIAMKEELGNVFYELNVEGEKVKDRESLNINLTKLSYNENVG